MNRFQQGSLFKAKRKGCSDVWVFRWYDYSSGERIYKKQIIGNMTQIRSRQEAEKAVMALRSSINVEIGTPQTVGDLAAHYRVRELTREKKSFSTIDTHRFLFKRYVEPRWGNFRLGAVRTMEVEEWLHSLPLAPSSKAKLKCILSTLYNHAIRYEWLTFNPISKVRTSQKRLREKDVLTPEEFQSLIPQLCIRDRAMVLLIGSTGLRRSEMIALTWSDLNMRTMEVNVLRSCVRNRIGKTKTEASCRPVPLHPIVLSALLQWRSQSSYAGDLDFLFPSNRFKGAKPLPCLFASVKRTNSRTAPFSFIRAVASVLSSPWIGNRAAFSDSRSNFHTRVGYRTNVCRRRLASDSARASEGTPAQGALEDHHDLPPGSPNKEVEQFNLKLSSASSSRGRWPR